MWVIGDRVSGGEGLDLMGERVKFISKSGGGSYKGWVRVSSKGTFNWKGLELFDRGLGLGIRVRGRVEVGGGGGLGLGLGVRGRVRQ